MGDPVPANIWFLGRPTHNTDAILQAYRLLGLVLRLANFELNESALGIFGTAVVLSIAIPETVSLSSLQF